MPTLSLSPAVTVTEQDLSTTIGQVATSITGTVGRFHWGPVNARILVTQERDIIDTFAKPDDTNYEDWYVAEEFLRYSNILYVVRVVDQTTPGTTVGNAGLKVVDDTTGTGGTPGYFTTILNEDDSPSPAISFGANDKVHFVARYPADESLSVVPQIKVAIANFTDFATADIVAGTSFVSQFDFAPTSTDQYAVAVLVDDEITEKHIVSRTAGTKNTENKVIYVDDWFANNSAWVWAFDNATINDEPDSIEATQLTGGKANAATSTETLAGYDLFANPEEFDINIILDGANNDATTHGHILDNIVDVRKDAVAILSPPKADVVDVINDSTRVTNLTTYKKTTLAKVSTYGALYGNWKYLYDKHNDKNRWIPVSGDVGGVYAFTDQNRDAWFAPAGYNRGVIKNVIKLAWNPNKARRDLLYKDQINPILNDPASGAAVVLGQKNLSNINSAFNRVDVRRLFIVMEKAISTAAKFYLFEKNNEFTRRRLKGEIEPFLRDIQGREGIDDFLVTIDTTNNTPTVINNNQLVADIYVKPSRSAEFINLSFIAVAAGVDFKELVKSPN
jgi:hypothetical protein